MVGAVSRQAYFEAGLDDVPAYLELLRVRGTVVSDCSSPTLRYEGC